MEFYIDDDSYLSVKAFDLSNEKNNEELKIETPKLFKDEEIEMLKNEEINMKDMKELIFEDYDKYKYDIIQKQEKINQSENAENEILELIDKLYYLLIKPYESLKIYFSFAKYYFCIINKLIEMEKKKKIIIDNDVVKKIGLSIGDIFNNIQFYDNNENNIFSKEENYSSTLREMIDDLRDQILIYNICLSKLLFGYIEKVKTFLFSLQLRKNEEKSKILDIIYKSSYYLKKADKIFTQMQNNIAKINTLNQLTEITFDSSDNYGIMIKDLKNIIEVKTLLVNKDYSKNRDYIQKLYDNYIGNSFYMLKNENDLQLFEKLFLETSFDMLKNEKDLGFFGRLFSKTKDEIPIEKYIKQLDEELKERREKKKICNDLGFSVSHLFYIMENISPNNDYSNNLKSLRDRFCDIKGHFKNDISGKEDEKQIVYNFVISLRAYYDNYKNDNIIYTKVCIYLNKLIELIECI